MGFGYMIFGVLFFAKATYFGIDFLPDIVAFALMMVGIGVARQHCHCFDSTYAFTKVGLVVSSVRLVVEVGQAFGPIFTPDLAFYISVFCECFTLCYLVNFLYGVSLIARQTDLPKLRVKSLRNIVVTVFLWFGYMFYAFNSYYGWTELDATVQLILTLFPFIYTILIAITTFTCYMRICLEGDENMDDPREGQHRFKTPFDIAENARRRDAERGYTQPSHATHKKRRKK